MAITRRGLLKRVAGGVGATIGALVGYRSSQRMGRSAERAIREFYGVSEDILKETFGTVEAGVRKQVEETRDYLGKSDAAAKTLAEYWKSIGVLGEESYKTLSENLDELEEVVNANDLPERIVRLRDRLDYRLRSMDSTVEGRLPKKIQKINDYFRTTVLGKEHGRGFFEKYNRHLSNLVSVYNLNEENLLTQRDLLEKADEYFEKSRQEVAKRVDKLLASGEITDSEERKYFEEIGKLSRREGSGRDVFETLILSEGYGSTFRTMDTVHRLNEGLEDVIGHLGDVQEILREGETLKDSLRNYSDTMDEAVHSYAQRVEEKQRELKRKGYEINVEALPRLAEHRDALIGEIEKHRRKYALGAAAAGAIAGGMVAGGVADRVVGKKVDRREILGLRKKTKTLEAENNRLREKKGKK